MSRLGVLLLALAILNAALALALGLHAREATTVYVFTPLVDVVPGGVPLSAAEAADLASGVRHQVDQRDIQQAFARLGSTLSLTNLLQGVEGLEEAGLPLAADQRTSIAAALQGAQEDYQSILEVQQNILDLERQVEVQTRVVLQALPGALRQNIEKSFKTAGNPPSPPPGGAP